MKKIKLLIWVAVGLFTTSTFSQKSQDEIFNQEVKRIKDKIVEITNKEKDLLKESVDSINTLLENGTISFERSNELKEEIAQKRARNIEEKVNAQNEKLSELVKSKAQGEVKSTGRYYNLTMSSTGGVEFKETGDTISKQAKRTHFDVLIAFGHNNLITDGDLPDYDDNFGCSFFEWGGSFKTKLSKNNNLLNVRYGVSFMTNSVSPKDNYIFSQNGNMTEVVDFGQNLTKNKFVNVYVSVPVHLELNFGRKDNYKVGIGGFVGYNLYSEQRLKYRDDGRKIKDITRKDWNVNDFQYGLSAYIGVGGVSLYAKYDLNPLFRNNTVEQHNISVGVRLDM